MKPPPARSAPDITADLQVCEVIYRYRSTEAVFKQYEADTGHCICCESLFQSLREVAAQYGLDLEDLLKRLKRTAAHQ